MPTASKEPLILTADGIGGVRIGDALASSGQSLFRLDPSRCGDTRAENGLADDDPRAARWVPAALPATTDPASPEPFFPTVDDGGRVVGFALQGTTIATDAGVRLGSTIQDVERAYPAASSSTVRHSRVWTVPGTVGSLRIEAALPDDATAPDQLNRVVSIAVVPVGTPPKAVYGTDASGICPV